MRRKRNNSEPLFLEDEIWVDVGGYEGYYKVSTKSRFKSLKRFPSNKEDRIMISNVNKACGYNQVKFTKDGKTTTNQSHRIIAKAFIPNPNNYPCVNHKDRNRGNNDLDNLEWVSYSMNTQHAYDNGLIHSMTGVTGKDHPLSIKVNQYDLEGNFIREWDSIKDIWRELNYETAAIIRCCKGKQKTSYGFLWKYSI